MGVWSSKGPINYNIKTSAIIVYLSNQFTISLKKFSFFIELYNGLTYYGHLFVVFSFHRISLYT